MIKVNVIPNNIRWKKYLKNPQNYLDKKIKLINKKNILYKKKLLTFSIMLSDSKEIKRLNKKFRNKNKSTDVLSFPFYKKKKLKENILKKKEIYLGDVVISINNIKNRNIKKEFFKELNKLWIHGLLHLFGHDHKYEREYKKMKNLENKFYQLVK
tara:strand:- start:228 stop:692 length:465 start_codon:yes stop_codon:yes gene_type:complete